MSETLEVTVTVRKDGAIQNSYPATWRIPVDEIAFLTYEQLNGPTYVAIPQTSIATLRVVLIRADKDIIVRLSGQSDAGIFLAAGGALLLMETGVSAAQIQTAFGDTTIKALLGG